ncbi:cardiolipin synthase B, partial [Pseudomonas syringae pv. actinidiae]|nr:cardiolipin synthase B [Pseudomonas syringae pv. actinidiae]
FFCGVFPAIAGLFPVHGVRLKPLRAGDVVPEAKVIEQQNNHSLDQEKTL